MRVIVKNSHDHFRESGQTQHARLELATKLHLPAVEEQLVKVLNESNVVIRTQIAEHEAKGVEVTADEPIPVDNVDKVAPTQ